MQDWVTAVDKDLKYISHEMEDEKQVIHVEWAQAEARCPYCGRLSKKIHAQDERSLQDLPISGKKVGVTLENRKYFCQNAKCPYKTFAERFSFFEPKATKTRRVQEEILRVSLTQSSLSAAR